MSRDCQQPRRNQQSVLAVTDNDEWRNDGQSYDQATTNAMPLASAHSRPAGQTNETNAQRYVSLIIESGRTVTTYSTASAKRSAVVAAIEKRTKPRHCLFVEGLVSGHPVPDMLLDSGSVITICSARLFKQIRASVNCTLDPVDEFSAANGSELHFLGVTDLKLVIGGINVTHPIYISTDIVHDFLLGNDFIDGYHCDVLTSLSTFVAGGVSVNISRKVLKHSVNSIVLSNNVKHEPRQEVLRGAELHDDKEVFELDSEPVLEPNDIVTNP